jgi:hypothetical protein
MQIDIITDIISAISIDTKADRINYVIHIRTHTLISEEIKKIPR